VTVTLFRLCQRYLYVVDTGRISYYCHFCYRLMITPKAA
jgi:hypothetical protein